jgi:hypothetical protein
LIDRIRKNDGEDMFTSVSQLGYIKDKAVIEQYLNSYGRANYPKQVRFYGSIESPLMPQQRVTAILETCQSFLANPKSVSIEGFLVTCSRWRVLKPLVVAEIVFAPDAIKSNPAVSMAFNHHMAKLDSLKDKEYFSRLAQFYSEEFARTITTNDDYKISATFSNLIMDIGGLSGIVYPSVPSNYIGQNVVLKTDIADSHLELDVVATLRIHKNGDKQVINNHRVATDFGKNGDKFIWLDADPQYVSSQMQIEEYLEVN